MILNGVGDVAKLVGGMFSMGDTMRELRERLAQIRKIVQEVQGCLGECGPVPGISGEDRIKADAFDGIVKILDEVG